MVKQYNYIDPLLQPDSGVLRNLHDVNQQDLLDQIEADLTATRTYQLHCILIPGTFDLEHLKAVHHQLFQDTYAWAGQIRTVDISKGTTRFANHQFIESEMRKISLSLQKDWSTPNLESSR